ncbi:MAG: sulfatase-like hydrolase/transferase [Anaerolineae bacterium]|nr:sulfatase-like hydrolase/transferase [Anaerolineae bacterium]MCA9891407.1 sulfatase-like hydrolase/transferase [Anaerolineae bacterium]MCB9458685.1 sulfatase-like hydrolase/transferase [Anaerolineaceae bacterium]
MPNIKSPNILLITDDQHRWDYLGCYGANFVDTPNIDRLAQRGIRFTNTFTNVPVCAPARIGLASGMHPARLGPFDNQTYLPSDWPTYYQRLRDNGYRVGCVGKLDLAKPDHYNGRYGDRPMAYRWGFTHPEECEGKMHAALGYPRAPLRGPYTYYLEGQGQLEAFCEDYQARAKNGYILGASHDSVLATEHFEDTYIGRRSAEFIENVPDDFPWHLFVSFVGPHDPYDPPTEYADMYRDAPMPDGIPAHADQKPGWIHKMQKQFDGEQLARIRRQYCALIKLIDDQIGMILDALEKRGMLDNTYIIFASDHGEMMGDHHLFTKRVGYEPSIHVPLICAGPGIAESQVSDTFVELIDINPTICELAGISPAPNLDARSFAPVLLGEQTSHRNEAITAMPNWRGVRNERYMFIENHNDIYELYDILADPDETTNVADQHPDVIKDMRKRFRDYFLSGHDIATQRYSERKIDITNMKDLLG